MSLPRRRRLAGFALVLAGAVGLSGCGGSGATEGGDHVVRSGSTSPAVAAAPGAAGSPTPGVSAAGPTPSAIVTAWPVTSPAVGGGGSGSGGGARCLSGTVEIVHPGSDNPLRSVCVRVGAVVHVVLRAEPGAPWRGVVSSAPQVVTVATDAVTAGSVDASAQAVGPGTAVLSASTRAGVEAGGLAARRWQLTVTVVP